jgi:hypothetical protein
VAPVLLIQFETVVELMQAYTTGLEGKIQFVRKDVYVGGSTLVFGIDDTFAWSLRKLQPPWTVNLGSDQRRFKYAGKAELMERLVEANIIDRLEVASLEDEVEDISDK